MTHVDKFSSFAHMMLMFYTQKKIFFFPKLLMCGVRWSLRLYFIRDYKTVRCNELNAGKEEDINGR